MKLLYATAEMAPLARVGGLAEAAGGLVAQLRDQVDLTVLLPDYGGLELDGEQGRALDVPSWAGTVWARSGTHPEAGPVTLIGSDELLRPHPYEDATGLTWPDNDMRFMQFSAGIAALRDELHPDVLHLNDWHTAAASALGVDPVPTVLTIHTLGYQGVASPDWLRRLERSASDFFWYGQINPLAGGITLADIVVAVSPNYSQEILTESSGMGLHELLAAKGEALVGIRNGIDTAEWDPETDPHIAANYARGTLDRREACRRDLPAAAGWSEDGAPVIGVVSRLVDQKGIDLLLAAVPFLETMPARLMVLGSGMADLTDDLRAAAAAVPDRVQFRDGYDLELAHRIFAGADILAMPSRFEPCGLAQMQAMRYGTLPVVTPVGGLVDTVTDIDTDGAGTGVIARQVDVAGFVDALHRAVRAWKHHRRRQAMQRRGMETDWSWRAPAAEHLAIYRRLAGLT